MADQNLKEFFREKVSKVGPSDIDWQRKKDRWIAAIDRLYEQITKDYLAELVKDKIVAVSYPEKSITEDYIGQYTVRDLVLQVGDEKVVFSPKGTNIVGATGRIDLCGDFGEVTLVQQPGERWGVVATRTPTLKVLPLDEESLLIALKSVMRK